MQLDQRNGCNNEMGIEQVRFAIVKSNTLGVVYLTTRALHYRLRGSSVPLASGREARVNIGAALCNAAELQRAASLNQLNRTEFVDE